MARSSAEAIELYPDWREDTYRHNLSSLNVLSEDPEKVPIKEVTKMQRRYEEAYKQIREKLDYLKELVKERK